MQALRAQAALVRRDAADADALTKSRQQTLQQYQTAMDAYTELQLSVEAAAARTVSAQVAASRHRAEKPQTAPRTRKASDVEYVSGADLIEDDDVEELARGVRRARRRTVQAKVAEATLRKALASRQREYDVAVQEAAAWMDADPTRSLWRRPRAAEEILTRTADGLEAQATALKRERSERQNRI